MLLGSPRSRSAQFPAGIQPVIGTTRPERILACRDAVRVAEEFAREDWYSLYLPARGGPVP